MKRYMWRVSLIAGVAFVALATIATPAMAAGPRIMIVYGRSLARPVIFTNWGENEALMLAVNDGMSVTNARLKGRPSLRVALFWGMEWVRYVKQHRPISALRPDQANQFARFYPAYGAAPALFVFDAIPGPYTSLIRRVGPAGIAVLARHGIPVRLPARAKFNTARLSVLAGHTGPRLSLVGVPCIRLLRACNAVLGDTGHAQNAPTHRMSTIGEIADTSYLNGVESGGLVSGDREVWQCDS